MKHVQNGRPSVVEVREATEKDCAALVLTCEGLHSDVFVLTLDELSLFVGEAMAVRDALIGDGKRVQVMTPKGLHNLKRKVKSSDGPNAKDFKPRSVKKRK